MAAPAAIQKLPYELISEIILLVGTEFERFSIFCRLSRALRDVALDTPGLWNSLSTTCDINIQPSLAVHIDPSYIEYLYFWTERVKNRSDFALQFEVDICNKKKEKIWIELEDNSKAKIFKLISCARRLITSGTGLCFLARWFRSETPWLLESIVFNPTNCLSQRARYLLDGAPGIEPLLCAFNLPSLRQCRISDAMTCPISYQTDLKTWSQLTHIDITLRTTLSDWRTFVVALRFLQSASLKIDLHQEEDEDGGTKLHDSIQHTIADLGELWLQISCWWDPAVVGSVLDGIHLPNLKTLIVESPRLTIDSLHRLLRNKRLVERIRVCSMFPTVAADTDLLAFPSTGESLMEYAPRLTRLVISLPDLDYLQQSATEYVDSIRQSRWLKGRNEQMQIVLPWLTTLTQAKVDNLQQHLCFHGFGDVVIKSRWPLYRQEFGVSRWDNLVDFESQF